MPSHLLGMEPSASRLSVRSWTAEKTVCVYDYQESGISIASLTKTSAPDRDLPQSPTSSIELEATSDSVSMSAQPANVSNENGAAQALKPTTVTLLAPTAVRHDAARRPNTPFHRPDTPHPRRSRPSDKQWAVTEQIPSIDVQTATPSVTRSQSGYCDARREDFKHEMFLAWLDRGSTH